MGNWNGTKCEKCHISYKQFLVFQPLTAEENARYEDLSKGYYQDFYPAFNNHQKTAHQIKRNVPEERQPQNQFAELPTDKDLAELLEDVSREEGQLNLLFDDKHPILNNVSLAEGIVYTQSNLTDMQEIHDSCNQVTICTSPTSSATSSQPTTLFNNTDLQTVEQWLPTEMGPSDGELFIRCPFPFSDSLSVSLPLISALSSSW